MDGTFVAWMTALCIAMLSCLACVSILGILHNRDVIRHHYLSWRPPPVAVADVDYPATASVGWAPPPTPDAPVFFPGYGRVAPLEADELAASVVLAGMAIRGKPHPGGEHERSATL